MADEPEISPVIYPTPLEDAEALLELAKKFAANGMTAEARDTYQAAIASALVSLAKNVEQVEKSWARMAGSALYGGPGE